MSYNECEMMDTWNKVVNYLCLDIMLCLIVYKIIYSKIKANVF